MVVCSFEISAEFDFAMCTTSEFVDDFVVINKFASRDGIDIDISNVCLLWCLAVCEMEERTGVCSRSIWRLPVFMSGRCGGGSVKTVVAWSRSRGITNSA